MGLLIFSLFVQFWSIIMFVLTLCAWVIDSFLHDSIQRACARLNQLEWKLNLTKRLINIADNRALLWLTRFAVCHFSCCCCCYYYCYCFCSDCKRIECTIWVSLFIKLIWTTKTHEIIGIIINSKAIAVISFSSLDYFDSRSFDMYFLRQLIYWIRRTLWTLAFYHQYFVYFGFWCQEGHYCVYLLAVW